MIVYKITNKINGKIYIGCTTAKLQRRWMQHINKGVSVLSKAIKKYGSDNFTKEIIETVDSLELLFEREIYWVSFYNSNISGIGYNMTKGGEVPNPLKGKDHPNFGKPNPHWAAMGKARLGTKLSERHRQIIIDANTGLERSEEYKKNMSQIKKDNYELNPITWGNKISAAKKGIRNFKNPMILCLNNYKVYNTYAEAAKALGVSAGNIPQVVNGKYSHTKGYVFQRISEDHLIF